ncbi:TIGR03016 family PEP-CTERM system-associated outer membrane protein [Rhodoferax sp. PAMC 29310]|uniref:TIGR03016 family PEP-CTERM system-associated outer membrane protein n=1 Tax=Rhodoferax sp. PAMC 29310 TaxID=2822760 RepID=UPI001B33DB7B|nr:TIGR03016 family PEP-CTERM system-associated outer membrane protein [Rhodoferax sp. PAMC 29310]
MNKQLKKPRFLIALCIGASGAGHAEVTVVPRVSVAETITDNVRLSSTDRQSEQITQLSPGIRIDIKGSRVRSYFDYALTQSFYAQNTSPSRAQNTLSTFGTLEAVDNRVFLDFNGSISQQSVSAFGTQSLNSSSINANQAEVSTYRLSPYVRGQLGSTASYEARYSRAVTSSDSASASASNTTNSDATVKVAGGSAFRRLGWSADASRQESSYSVGRTTEVDRFNLGLNYALTPQLNVSVNGGQESNNYTSLDKQTYGTSSVGFNWVPSNTTKLSANVGRRSFGNTHSLSFEHRTARTVWRFVDSKDASTTPSQSGRVGLGNLYDLLYSQLESTYPADPVARAQAVNDFLAAYGLNGSSLVAAGFLSSAASLQRNQSLSLALLGARDTITFFATSTESSRIDALSIASDDLSTSSRVRQRGFSVSYSHRLTPDYSLGVLLSQQKTSGDLASQDSTLRSINANITGRVGKKATVSVAARHVVSSGNAAPYVENAITGNLNVQF